MSKVKPVLVKNLDLSKVVYSSLIKNKNGGKVMSLTYEGKPLLLQLPKMYMPFGASDYNNNRRFSVNFSFNKEDTQQLEALEKLKQLDDKIIRDAAQNSKEWFDTERTEAIIRDTYQSQIKEPSDSKYNPRLKANLMSDGRGGFRCTFLNDYTSEIVNVTEDNISVSLPPRSEGTAILECSGIWIVQKTLTLTWKVIKMKFSRGDENDIEFDLEDCDINETEVVDDSHSESSVDISEPEPEPVPKKRAKRAGVKA